MIRGFLIIFLFSFLLILGCGENKQSPENQTGNSETKGEKGDLENFAENMQNLSESFNEGKKVNPVDFRDLKALLPEQIGNLKRTNASGEKSSAMGINLSKAEADYSDEQGNKNIDVQITDLGSVSGLNAFAAYGWYMVDIDKETEDGYEKTFVYKSNKGYERYNNNSKDGEVSVLVARRFVVEINGNNVSMNELKSTLDLIDISKLEAMKDFGVEK
uniref:Lipoprotein n=1 Tax=Ignavibacterium album TaxID=591197 RepID=A0A7V2ZMA1_9BACT